MATVQNDGDNQVRDVTPEAIPANDKPESESEYEDGPAFPERMYTDSEILAMNEFEYKPKKRRESMRLDKMQKKLAAQPKGCGCIIS